MPTTESLYRRLLHGHYGLPGKLALVLLMGPVLAAIFALCIAVGFAPEILHALRSPPAASLAADLSSCVQIASTAHTPEPGGIGFRHLLAFVFFCQLIASGMVLDEDHLARTGLGAVLGIGLAALVAHSYDWHLDALTLGVGVIMGGTLGLSAHQWAAGVWQLLGGRP